MPKTNFQCSGITLVELLVGVAIFGLIMMVLVNITLGTLRVQGYAVASQALQENLRYALELMQRELRMAQPSQGGCLGSPGQFFSPSSGETTILTFINDEDECVTYSLQNRAIRRAVTGGDSGYLTSSDKVAIDELKFRVSGDDQAQTQPRVTISISASSSGRRPTETAQISLQTTVSPRPLDLWP